MLILAVGPSEEHSKHQIQKTYYFLRFLRSERNPWVWSCLFVWFSRMFLQNQTKVRENQKYKRKPKNTKTSSGKTEKHKVFKCFRPTLGYGFVVFCFLCVSRRFLQNQTILRENQNIKENKTFGKTVKHKNKPISKGGSETFKTLVLGFSRRFFLCSLVFFSISGFLEGLFGFVKTFGKTEKPKKTNPYPRVGLKHLKTLFLVFTNVFCFIWFSCVFLVFSKFCLIL